MQLGVNLGAAWDHEMVDDPRTEAHNTIGLGAFSGQAVQAGAIGSVHFGGSGGGAVPVDRAIRDLAPLLDSVLERGFAGREWLIDQIDEFLRRHRCGYVWVEAEAGMGKTALCAHLIRKRAWIGHFARLANGGLVRVGLQNLAAQIVARYELWELAPSRTLPEWTFTPEGFEAVLAHAAEHSRQAGNPLILLIDGADEAETPEGMQPWGLPGLLPSGVFVVGTYRAGSPPPRCDAPRAVLPIHPGDVHNQHDVAWHLDSVLREDVLAARLVQAGVAPREFAAHVAARCSGVWVYLRYVLDEIRLGLRDPRELDELPADLPSFYTAHLAKWCREPHWRDGLLPLLVALAVVREPLPVATLAHLSGVDDTLVREWCQATLRPFLTATSSAPDEATGLVAPRRFEIYHASLREVLGGARSDAHGTEEERAWADVLAPAAVAAHRRIGEYYLAKFGGLDTGLAALACNPGLAGADGGYALSHLARHLMSAGRAEDLHRLLQAEEVTGSDQAVNVWFAAHDHAGTVDGYLADIATARRDCERHTDHALAARRPAPTLADEMRYLLITASITSLTNNVPVQLLVCLLEQGMWSWERALAHAYRLATPRARAEALAAIVRTLPIEQQPEAVFQALAATKIITNRDARARMLAMLAPHLSVEQLADAVATAQSITNREARVEALAGLVPYLPADQRPAILSDALAIVHGRYMDRDLRWRMLAALASQLPAGQLIDQFTRVHADLPAMICRDMPADAVAAVISCSPADQRSVLLADVLTTAQTITYGDARAEALARVAAYLPAGQKPAVVTEALAAMEAVSDESQSLSILSDELARMRALVALAPHLSIEQLVGALPTAQAITNEDARAEALAAIAPHLPADLKPAVLNEALAVMKAMPNRDARVKAVTRLAPYLPVDQRAAVLANLLASVTTIAHNDAYAQALARLTPYLPTNQLAQTLQVTMAITSKEARAKALVALAPYLSVEQLADALTAVLTVNDEGERAKALVALAPYLSVEQLAEALAAAAAIIDEDKRAKLLVALAPYLSVEQLAEALAAAAAIIYVNPRVSALVGFAPYLAADQLATTLQLANSITYDNVRARALAGLVPYLSEDQRSEALADALAAALAAPYEDTRAAALAELVPHLPDDQLAAVLAAVKGIDDGNVRARALAGLVPYLSEDQRSEALADVQAAALAAPYEDARATALTELVPYLPASQRSAALEAAVTAAQAIGNRGERVRRLICLAEYVPVDRVAKALTASEPVINEETGVRLLVELAPYLPAAQIAKALQLAKTVAEEDVRAQALAGLAPHLPLDQLAPAALSAPYGSVEALHSLLVRAGQLHPTDHVAEYVSLLRTVFRAVNRDVFLALLDSCAATLQGIVGSSLGEQLATALRDTHRWWI